MVHRWPTRHRRSLAPRPRWRGQDAPAHHVAAELRERGWTAGFLDRPHDEAPATLKQRWQALDQLIAHGDDAGLLRCRLRRRPPGRIGRARRPPRSAARGLPRRPAPPRPAGALVSGECVARARRGAARPGAARAGCKRATSRRGAARHSSAGAAPCPVQRRSCRIRLGPGCAGPPASRGQPVGRTPPAPRDESTTHECPLCP